jgi:DNA end-binding protein Ku
MPKARSEETSSIGPFWSGTITFGLVSVPVELVPANRSNHLSLRSLAPDGTPLRRQYVSSETGHELSPHALVRAYDRGKAGYVVVTDDELDKLAPEKTRDIDLRVFVDANQIHPIYFEHGYVLMPAGESAKAYRLLAAVLESGHRAGIATFVMRGKEYLISIIAEDGILRAETMRFKDEIRTPAEVGLPERQKVPEKAMLRFERIISHQAAATLPLGEMHDPSTEALMKIIKLKRAHKENLIVHAESGEEAKPDLAASLKKSLTSSHGRRRKIRTTAKPRHAPRNRSRRAGGARRAA